MTKQEFIEIFSNWVKSTNHNPDDVIVRVERHSCEPKSYEVVNRSPLICGIKNVADYVEEELIMYPDATYNEYINSIWYTDPHEMYVQDKKLVIFDKVEEDEL